MDNDLLLPGTGCVATFKVLDVSLLEQQLQDDWFAWLKDNPMPVLIQMNSKTMVPFDHWYKFVKSR
jgi:hypothetical protein